MSKSKVVVLHSTERQLYWLCIRSHRCNLVKTSQYIVCVSLWLSAEGQVMSQVVSLRRPHGLKQQTTSWKQAKEIGSLTSQQLHNITGISKSLSLTHIYTHTKMACYAQCAFKSTHIYVVYIGHMYNLACKHMEHVLHRTLLILQHIYALFNNTHK